MAAKNEIWIIGTDPPCPRCDILGNMAHAAVHDLGLSVRVRHFAFADEEAVKFAASLGRKVGTAKHVAAAGGVEMDWEAVYALIEEPPSPDGKPPVPSGCCGTAGARWTPELDAALKPREIRADKLGFFMTPVLVVAGKVAHHGSVPTKEQVSAWISDAFPKGAPAEGRINIEVLGPGCANCETVYNNVFTAVDKLGIADRVAVTKVTDITEIARRGVPITPGLIIDGQVKSKGKVLSVDQIAGLLAEMK